MKKRLLCLTVAVLASVSLAGCQQKDPEPGDIAGYDDGEEYLSIWVHSIEDTEEGQAYRESVDSFNEAYDGEYFADIEFVPRNDSGGGYSDKVNASVMAGGLPDVLTVDGPNISAYAANGIIQPLAELTEEERGEYLRKGKFFGTTLLCFHTGVAIAFLGLWFLGLRAVWLCLILILAELYMIEEQRAAQREAQLYG